ncbi:hypothetical protein PUN28_001569 [Cardiocondyla obscurior]|uniref:Uncharacterized protein n=1 Tax=Cardiocondyla obscurior TaxID=286306 RepID=A0AAW2H5N3_9HYME
MANNWRRGLRMRRQMVGTSHPPSTPSSASLSARTPRGTKTTLDDGEAAAGDGHHGSRLELPRSTERQVTVKASLIIRDEAHLILRLNDPVEAVQRGSVRGRQDNPGYCHGRKEGRKEGRMEG